MNFKDRIHKMIKESLVTKLNSLNEGPSTPQSRLRKVMKNIKKFETPFTVVVIENNKVIDQKHSIKDWRLIPAYYREMLKKYPNATVHVEDGGGRRVQESVNEGVMSELDILAKEAKDLKAFVKEAEKMLGGKADKNTIKWLALVYKTAMTESVNESSKWKSREDVIDSLVKDFKEKASSFNNTSSNQQREKFWTYNKLMQHHAKLSKKNESVNEAEKWITNGFKVGDKIKTNIGVWEVIETDYKPGKSFMAPFIFKGKNMKKLNIPNPPKTNKNAVGYKVTDGDKFPIIGFLYQYGDITKLATVGVDESVNEGKVDWDNIAKEVANKLKKGSWPWAIKNGVENITPENIKSVLISGGYTTNTGVEKNIGGVMDKILALVKESVNEARDFKKGNKVSYKDDDGKLQVGIILKKMTNTFRGKKIVQFLIGKDGNTNTNYADRVSALSGREDEKLQSESVVTEASADGYNLHRLANNVGQNVADAFLSKHNVNFNLLAKAIQQRTINKYELRDIVNGTAPASKLKNFVKTFVKESVTEQVITEGVNDPNILKAVFLAGGPGSGKSFSAEQVFGIDSVMKGTSALGLKIVNSDPAFENELKKRGVDPKNLALMTDKVFAYYTSAKPGSARGKAKKLKTKLERIYHDGRLGLILDGTGHDFGKIAKKKKRLEQLGYDTSMLFINTSLQVAQERNKSRDRTLPEDLLEKMWQDVQNNMGKFQTLFGSKFHILDNSEMGDFSKMHNDKIKAVTKMIKAPLKNPIGKQWIEDAQKLKRLQ
jgi:hypothetical protein